MKRTDTYFISSGARCAAWFWEPEGAGPRPAVLLCHGFGAIKEARLDAYGDRFAQAGFAVLAIDYRHFGGSEGEPRHVGSVRRQLEDIAAALAHLRAQPQVDPERVALWGTSFGGGHVLVTAARDARVAAVIAQCPFMNGLDLLAHRSPTYVLMLPPLALYDVLRRAVGAQPFYLPIVGPPGSLAAMHGPDDEPGYLALMPKEPVPWENKINAAMVFRVGSYHPVSRASKVRCPVLFCVCDGDTVVRPETSFEAARRTPRSEVRHYPCGHFGIYLGEMFEQTVKDQIEFLRVHLLKPAAA